MLSMYQIYSKYNQYNGDNLFSSSNQLVNLSPYNNMKELKFVNPNFRGWLIKYIFTGSYFRGYQIYKEKIISKYMEIVLMLLNKWYASKWRLYIILRWILKFVDWMSHKSHEYWFPTNKKYFIVMLYGVGNAWYLTAIYR